MCVPGSFKGQIKTIKYGNNTKTDYTYSNDLRLEKILTQNQSLATLQELYYNFDKAGNLKELTNNLRAYYKTTYFEYDNLNRLKTARNIAKSTGGYQTLTYQYDSIGNMTYKSDLGIMQYGQGNAGPHALTTAAGYIYQYDANGNMTKGKNKSMAYSAQNRLLSVVKGGKVTSFTYDGDGGRVKQRIRDKRLGTTQETVYIGSLFEIVTAEGAEGETRSTRKNHIFAGSTRVCSIRTTSSEPRTTSYYHTDHLGSSSVISDKNGNKAADYEYQPYGTVASSTLQASSSTSQGTNYLFTGKELDQASGLYYYGARYYDPEIGRFTQADTIVQSPFNPQSLNRYSYCWNNSLKYIDPSGHFLETLIWTIIIIAVAWGVDQLPNSDVNVDPGGPKIPFGPGGNSTPSSAPSSGRYPSSSGGGGCSSSAGGPSSPYQSAIDLLLASIYEGAEKYNKDTVISEDPTENNIKRKSIDGNIQAARDAGRAAEGPAGAIKGAGEVVRQNTNSRINKLETKWVNVQETVIFESEEFILWPIIGNNSGFPDMVNHYQKALWVTAEYKEVPASWVRTAVRIELPELLKHEFGIVIFKTTWEKRTTFIWEGSHEQ